MSLYFGVFTERLVILGGRQRYGFRVGEPRAGGRKGSVALSGILTSIVNTDLLMDVCNNPVEHAVGDVTN